ncbi:hypothetical protein [Haloechinothrix salitolerans]|uniref:Holin-X, holin superfamily III n=1 Tax=Haloechinothrix salitolerans TaxID=926830 RepID=A0ABW2BTC3_9PSEU
MSEPVHQTVRYGTGTGPVTRSDTVSETSVSEASLPSDDHDTAIAPAVGDADEVDERAYDDGHRDDQWQEPEDDQWQESADVADDTTEFVRPAPAEEAPAPSRLGVASERMAASSHTTGVWIGLVLALAGFGAIVFTWSKVAGLTNVAEQMPYLVSGGIAGLVLIIAGATVIDVVVRRRDSKERTEQLAQMTRALAEVREMLESESRQREAE